METIVKVVCLVFAIGFMIAAVECHGFRRPKDQASALHHLRLNKFRGLVASEEFVGNYNIGIGTYTRLDSLKDDDHLLKDGLPGQPSSVTFKQYAGYIDVDKSAGRSLFYYFAEAANSSSMKPLILWLNGGPSCSSFGMGAMTEIGPFGVNPDGESLYSREFAWNKVANVLFLESPAGVGFSYSNTTSDYELSGDQRTAEDAYTFLMNWFGKYPQYKGRDFYLMGESYAGYYIPELANVILEMNKDTDLTPIINLVGIMIGNGLINDVNDTRGQFDYLWNHALISNEDHQEFLEKCPVGIHVSEACAEVQERVSMGLGNLDVFNIYSPTCDPSHPSTTTQGMDPCEPLHVIKYLNIPQVQEALHANRTKLPYPWTLCSEVFHHWNDSPSSMFVIYKNLMVSRLRILLYSGDVDACVPVTGTRYALAAMDLKVIEPWHWWTAFNTTDVAGYKVAYVGLTYATVRGGGHEVSRSRPDRLFALLMNFISK